MNNVSKEKGEKFESIVEKIYIQIANNERIKAKVEKHVPIIGDDIVAQLSRQKSKIFIMN